VTAWSATWLSGIVTIVEPGFADQSHQLFLGPLNAFRAPPVRLIAVPALADDLEAAAITPWKPLSAANRS